MKAITQLYSHKLPQDFYLQEKVAVIAKSLLGKVLVSFFDGQLTAGRIVETEAYNGVMDKASHAWGGRRTSRTETMYAPGGISYVYLCYGIHHLFNVVTNQAEIPHAILIRGIEPILGKDIMMQRTGKTESDVSVSRGPGNVSKAMGIKTSHDGISLHGKTLFIADDGYSLTKSKIIATPRIGVDYAGEDALLPYRFIVKDNSYVSGTHWQIKKPEKSQ